MRAATSSSPWHLQLPAETLACQLSEHRVNNRLLQPVVTGCRSVTMLTSAKRACPLFLPAARACLTLCSRSSAGSASFSSVFPATEDWDQSKIPDQSGKTFLITGSNAGLGFEAAKKLSANKGHVIMATRNPDKAKQYVTTDHRVALLCIAGCRINLILAKAIVMCRFCFCRAIEDIKKEVGEHASLEFLHVDLTDFRCTSSLLHRKQKPGTSQPCLNQSASAAL